MYAKVFILKIIINIFEVPVGITRLETIIFNHPVWFKANCSSLLRLLHTLVTSAALYLIAKFGRLWVQCKVFLFFLQITIVYWWLMVQFSSKKFTHLCLILSDGKINTIHFLFVYTVLPLQSISICRFSISFIILFESIINKLKSDHFQVWVRMAYKFLVIVGTTYQLLFNNIQR